MGTSAYCYLLSRIAALFLLLTGLLALPSAAGQAANGTVGTGSPASCTEAAFDTVFNAVQSSGGGTINFNCGPAAHTIILSAYKPVSANTVLQGGDLITLSGGNTTSLFQVFSGQSLTLSHITLSRGFGSFGAIQNFGTLTVDHSQLTNNSATVSGGAIENYGTLNLVNATLSGNSAVQNGGGIYSDGGTVTVQNSLFSNNTAAVNGGGSNGDGGALMGAAGTTSLTVTGSQFVGNRAAGVFSQGGAINSHATLTTISQCTFAQNSSSRGGGLSVMAGETRVSLSTLDTNWSAYGGGIRQEGGTLLLTDVRFHRNGYSANGIRVNTGGGAISWGNGTATLERVTLSDNWASYGGGFDHANGITNLVNVTITGNTAVGAGGFDMSSGTVNLVNVTIARNSANFFGGGIGFRGGTLTLKNTLLSGNFKTDNNQKWNCNATLPPGSATFSLSSDTTCGLGAGKDNLTLNLQPLANNGGFTQTHMLTVGSPAIDAGTGAGCPTTDQRGVPRPQGQACDVGALEVPAGSSSLFYKAYIPLTVR